MSIDIRVTEDEAKLLVDSLNESIKKGALNQSDMAWLKSRVLAKLGYIRSGETYSMMEIALNSELGIGEVK